MASADASLDNRNELTQRGGGAERGSGKFARFCSAESSAKSRVIDARLHVDKRRDK